MIERILVPLDGSELAEAALPYVEELAAKLNATVVLLRVVPSLVQVMAIAMPGHSYQVAGSMNSSGELARDAYESQRAAAEGYLAAIQQRLREQNIPSESLVREGDPSDVILELATDVSMIAMSTHGRGGLGRLVLGSVADHVLRQPPHTPMFLVRHPAEA